MSFVSIYGIEQTFSVFKCDVHFFNNAVKNKVFIRGDEDWDDVVLCAWVEEWVVFYSDGVVVDLGFEDVDDNWDGVSIVAFGIFDSDF